MSFIPGTITHYRRFRAGDPGIPARYTGKMVRRTYSLLFPPRLNFLVLHVNWPRREVLLQPGKWAQYGGIGLALLLGLPGRALAHGAALTARVEAGRLPGPVAVEVVDSYDNPVDEVRVEVSARKGRRPVSSAVALEPQGGGRYAGTLQPQGPGPWSLWVTVQRGPEMWRGRVDLPAAATGGKAVHTMILAHTDPDAGYWYGAAALALVADIVLLRLWWRDYAAARRRAEAGT